MSKRTTSPQKAVAQALELLVGEAFWGRGRAVDMETWQFGPRVWVTSSIGPRKGRRRQVGTYALHIQCRWRIVGREGLLVGYSDIGAPAVGGTEDPGWEELEKPGANLRDRKLAALFRKFNRRPLRVKSVEADKVGGARIYLTHGYVLEIIPDESAAPQRPIEYWRLLLSPAVEGSRHFVVLADSHYWTGHDSSN